MSQLCLIDHDFAATLYTQRACVQGLNLAAWCQVVGDYRDKTWDNEALVWPIRSRVITTSLACVRCCNFLGGPSVGFKRYRWVIASQKIRVVHVLIMNDLFYQTGSLLVIAGWKTTSTAHVWSNWNGESLDKEMKIGVKTTSMENESTW